MYSVKIYHVVCVNKSDSDNHHERITHLGMRAENGTYSEYNQQIVIKNIASGKWRCYLGSASRTVLVHVAESISGNKYLKTEHSRDYANNLLSLPSCRLFYALSAQASSRLK